MLFYVEMVAGLLVVLYLATTLSALVLKMPRLTKWLQIVDILSLATLCVFLGAHIIETW